MRSATSLSLIAAFLCIASLSLGACGRVNATKGDPALDPLFAALAAAPTPEAAAPIEARIAQAWAATESPTIDVLMERAETAHAKGRTDMARIYLDEAARLEPADAEIYARRAVIAFAEEDIEGALNDLSQALELEPRHFGALVGLGAIYERLGREEAALKAYQDALAINPHFEEARQGAARLAPKVDGEDI